MIKSKIALIIFAFIFFHCGMPEENKALIINAKEKYDFIEDFLSKYPEKTLITVMNFADDPDNHFENIKTVNDLFSYFAIMDRLGNINPKYLKLSWISILKRIFAGNLSIERKVEILTFLLLKADGYFGEMMVDEYIKLFNKNRSAFLKFFSERKDWKNVVHALGSGNWQLLNGIVEELEDSGFEGEFKRYVYALRDKERGKLLSE